MTQEYEEKHEMREKDAELNLRGFYPVATREFYRDVFPAGSFERLGHQEDCKPNGLALTIEELGGGRSRGRHTIITDGLEQLDELARHPFAIIAPISYYGRRRAASNASMLHALTLDIDYVNADGLCHLLDVRFHDEPGYGCLPRPTYLVNSGHGVHLYYLLDKPVPMYPENQRELLRLKKFLVDLIWDEYVSYKPEHKECLGLVQGFRMVGAAAKIEGETVRAYRIGERCGLGWLESFDRSGKTNIKIKDKRGMTIDEAKELYPDWYERRVVQGVRAGIPDWKPKRDLYDWWLRKATAEAVYGHRYFCIMTLAIFAAKCGIPREELEADALALRDAITGRGDEPLTENDVFAALKAYNENMRTFPREDLERITAIQMPANKRNWRRQEEHLVIARAMKDVRAKLGENVLGGRPKGSGTKRDLILGYAREHPKASQRSIAKALGVSPTTVNKWLNTRCADEVC